MMPADLKELLRVLNAHGVKFLVVGGYAFGASISLTFQNYRNLRE
jgi:hypothetical protein